MRLHHTELAGLIVRVGRAAAGAVALTSMLAVSPAFGQAQAPATTAAPAPTPAPPARPANGPAPAPGQAPPQRTAAQATYSINPGDELEIYVWGEERLQKQLRVLPDGTIAFPLVGQIKVQGLLPQNVERLISDGLKSQYRGEVPNVTVSVRNPSGMQFSVMGKVRSPGSFNPGRNINVLDAISLAGGPAEFANLDNVSIIRSQNGRTTVLRVRLGPVFKGGVSSGDVDRANVVPLAVGDIVIVP